MYLQSQMFFYKIVRDAMGTVQTVCLHGSDANSATKVSSVAKIVLMNTTCSHAVVKAAT